MDFLVAILVRSNFYSLYYQNSPSDVAEAPAARCPDERVSALEEDFGGVRIVGYEWNEAVVNCLDYAVRAM